MESLPIPMMSTMTAGTPYPTIRDLVIVSPGLLGLLDLSNVNVHSINIINIFISFSFCIPFVPDLSEDIKAHNRHPDKCSQEEIVIYATFKKYLQKIWNFLFVVWKINEIIRNLVFIITQ